MWSTGLDPEWTPIELMAVKVDQLSPGRSPSTRIVGPPRHEQGPPLGYLQSESCSTETSTTWPGLNRDALAASHASTEGDGGLGWSLD